MRVSSMFLGCALCVLLCPPSSASRGYVVAIKMSKPDITASQILSDRLHCVQATAEVNHYPSAFIRCMETRGYRLDPAGYRLTLFVGHPRSYARFNDTHDVIVNGPPSFVDVRHEQ